jgi:hypothetical protein
MGMHGSIMFEKDHEGNDKDFLLEHNIARCDKLFHILPKLWPPIVLKH